MFHSPWRREGRSRADVPVSWPQYTVAACNGLRMLGRATCA